MDSIIAALPATADGDLMLCLGAGVAYQRDMAYRSVRYDAAYLAKVDAYEDTPIAEAVNAGRCELLQRHLPAGASVLDIGAGSGAFVRAAVASGFAAKGFEVIAAAAVRLRVADLYADCEPGRFDAVSAWDVVEHLEDPGALLATVPGFLFASLPVFASLHRIRESRHYRPGEHLFYFTSAGFIAWAAGHGFRLLEQSAHEIEAGRDSIGAFAFRRALPGCAQHLLPHERLVMGESQHPKCSFDGGLGHGFGSR